MDWDHIKNLLEIVELSRGQPNLKAINDAAMHELELLANPPVEIEEAGEADGESEAEEETEDE